MTFRVGQKVVTICEWAPRPWVPHLPQMGAVYRIRAISEHLNGTGLLLEEIRNPAVMYVGEVRETSFGAAFFRPVVERKTDISVFVRMLTPAKEDA